MYRVEWNDFEGNYHHMDHADPVVVRKEAESLKEKFDYVEWGRLEHLYSVGMVDQQTGEKVNIKVWAETTDKATHKLTSALFGAYGPYRWTGTGPLYENNKVITRLSKV